jgi:hypothetical protein
MTKASNKLASLLHRRGAGRRVRFDAFAGTGAPSPTPAVNRVQPRTAAGKLTNLRVTTKLCGVAITLIASLSLAFTAAALAATPTVVSEFTSPAMKPSEEANLEAAVNPGEEAAGITTECHFQYGKAVVTEHTEECAQGNALEGGELGVSANVKGLTAGTTYLWRVVLKNPSGKIEGGEEKITTVPVPATEAPSPIGATTATFKGKLTPLNATVGTQYFFYYNREEEAFCTNERGTNTEPETPLTGSGAASVSTKVTELEANQKYTVCLASQNAFGTEEDLKSPPIHFKTLPAPPKIDGESAGANSTEATLFAQVNPNNESTKYVFEYSTTESNKKLTGTITTLTGGSELSGGSDQTAEAATGAVLEAGKTYYYRVVAENAQSEKEPHPAEGEVQSFTTVPTPTTDPATAIADTTATFNGHLTPLNPTTATQYHFDYKLSGSECTGESETAAGEAGKGTGAASEATPVTGLQPDRLYTVCFVTSNASGSQVGPPVTFRTLPETYTSNVASSSATLHAVLDPEGNGPTTYRFEYGTSIPYESKTEEGSVEASGAVTVEAHIQELSPGSVYHFRVSATTAAPETVSSEDKTFTTQGVGGSSNQSFALPDGRQYEMVSPPAKHGALIEPIQDIGVVQAAANGGAFTYLTSQPTESEPQGYSTKVQVLATRTGTGVWSDQDIETPHNGATGVSVGQGYEYQFFSPDLSQALVEPQGEFTPLAGEETSPQASEDTPYVRSDLTCQATPATCYTPLVTTANTPPGTKIELSPSEAGTGGIQKSKVFFEGATPDLSHVVLQSGVPLVEGAPAYPTEGGAPLYEWAGGKLQLVSVLPAGEGGEPATEVKLGGGPVGESGTETRNAISADGSRVIWSTEHREHGEEVQALYMSDTAAGKTESVRLDLPEAECLKAGTCGTVGKKPNGEEKPPLPRFDIASSDGSEVFFTDTQRLTADSRAGYGQPDGFETIEPDLYACNIEEVEAAGHRHLKCDLTDLTVDTNPDGERAAVVSSSAFSGVLGAGENGSYVYFVANGLLGDAGASGASTGDCGALSPSTVKEKKEVKEKETCNLYVEHYNGSGWEAPRFIATVSDADSPDWRYQRLETLASRVSPDGRYLAFSSQRSLTGYDNTDLSEHPTKNEEEEGVSAGTKVKHHDEEVYLYDAETGRTSCASCDPTGARPSGVFVSHGKGNQAIAIGEAGVWEKGTWLAADVPGWTAFSSAQGASQPRYLSDSGRLFFNSHDPLVPSDVNGTWDVYQYEPEGDGPAGARCGPQASSGSDLFEPARTLAVAGHDVQLGAGCVGLISSGESSQESAFLDASESGGDVFFLTASQLVPADVDHAYDVYDAHECGVEGIACTTATEVPPPCTTEASCKPAPEPPPSIYGAPASATFNGPGNLEPPPAVVVKPKTKTVKCVKGKHLSHNKCVKTKHKKKKAKGKKSSKTNRRTGR